MDLSRLSTGQIIAGVGGIVLFISLFLSWGVTVVTTSINGVNASSGNAFDAFSGIDIIMLIVAVLVVAASVIAAVGAGEPPASTGIVIGLLGVGVFGWCLGWDLENGSAGIGAWIALFASAAIAWGGFESARVPAPASRRRTAPPPSPTQAGAPPSSGPPPSGPPPSSEPPPRRRPPS